MTSLSKSQLASLVYIPKSIRDLKDSPNVDSSLYQAQLVATQVHKITQIGKLGTWVSYHSERPDIFQMLDSDLQKEIQDETSPENRILEEKESLLEELEKWAPESFELFQKEKKRYKRMRIFLKIYEDRVYKWTPLDEESKNQVGRQLIIELKHFQKLFQNLIQAAHNSVAGSSRGYTESDSAILTLYSNILSEIKRTMWNLFVDNYEIAIQARKDELKHTAQKLKGTSKKEGEFGSKYVTPASREKIIYGDESAGNYILAALRNGSNVELLGPTGTGKTRLAMEVCEQFSGKKPYILSGGPGVSRRDFYGSPTGLNTRNAGAIETCIKEDKVLIIDEDNRIDPRQIAEIKLLLGLKSGDTFTHPDTGEVFKIPAHFCVMVTRNEKGKHHTDRYDLPPDYRREFTHGSFEIGYYTPAEMYDSFLLPKLINDDGSISLSREEIGGNAVSGEYSPLLSLVKASEVIQKAYQENKLRNAVFESGYLIDFFEQWKEIRFKRKVDGSTIAFIEYMEAKLLEFLKRPIGNPDRWEILKTLLSYGFFAHTHYDVFRTENEGSMMAQNDFENAQKNNSTVFQAPSGTSLSADEVALLDPFGMRKIVIPEHPEEQKIQDFAKSLRNICSQYGLAPLTLTGKNIDKKETRQAIIKKLTEAAQKMWVGNISILQSTFEQGIGKKTRDFIDSLILSTSRISLYQPPEATDSHPRDARGRRIWVDPIILSKSPEILEIWGNLQTHDEYYRKAWWLVYTKYTALKKLQESWIDIDIINMPRSFDNINIDGIKAIFEKEPQLKTSLLIRIAEEYIDINGLKIRLKDDSVVYTHDEAQRFRIDLLSVVILETWSSDTKIQKLICEYILGMSPNDDYIIYDETTDKTIGFKLWENWKDRDHDNVRRIYR